MTGRADVKSTLQRLSVKKKLTLLLMGASAFAVLSASAVFYLMTTRQIVKSYREELQGLARIVGQNCQASLAFAIPEEAERVLASLTTRPSVTGAVIVAPSGAAFAHYGKAPAGIKLGSAALGTKERVAGYLTVTQEISLGGKTLGFLTLFDDMRGIKKARMIAVVMTVVAVVIAMAASLLLVAALGGAVAAPIVKLSSAAKRIAVERDFSLRAEGQGRDEIGQLVDSFNFMLEQIEARERELRAEIAERRRVEDDLRRAKEYTDNLIQGANVIVVGLDTAGKVTLLNRTAEMITGFSFEELLGQDWFGTICPRDCFPEVEGGYDRLKSNGMPDTFENQILTRDGQTRIISWRNNLIRDGESISGTLSFGIDITEHRKAEEQLQQAQKMEAIGRLAGGVAHDFNNKLSVILGYTELAMMKMGENDPLRQNLGEVITAAERSRDITRQLLAFSRKEVIAPRPINLNTLIIETQKTLGRLIGEDITLTFHPATEVWTVKADPSQIDQILMNLAVNARDAMPDGGNINIETANVTINEPYCRYHLDARPGDFVKIAVSDNGMGMDNETQRHIFEPFYTTKGVGKGTGLGLATVFGIVTQNNGFINVYSEPGQGATFSIYLPRAEEERQAALPAVHEIMAGTGTILLVEDDPIVLNMAEAMLTLIGYTVHKATDPKEAIELCKDPQKQVDLILTDVIMPSMSGREMAERIARVRPGIKMLYMSGYTSDIIAQKGVLEEGTHFIHKPFDMKTLQEKVKEALGG